MTDGNEINIPSLEELDHKEDEAAELAEDAEFSKCPGAKTKVMIRKNNNKCPETDCRRKLTDIPGYDSDEPSRSERSLQILTDWLDGLPSGQQKGTRAAKDQVQSPVRIKLPSFIK